MGKRSHYRLELLLVLLVLLLALPACVLNRPPAVGAASPELKQAGIAEIQATVARFARSMNARDADAAAEYYYDAAVVSLPGHRQLRGIAEIAAELRRLLSDQAFTFELDNRLTSVAASGDVGYSRGTYSFTYSGSNGATGRVTANYLTVFRRYADGSWRAVEDVSAPAPSAG